MTYTDYFDASNSYGADPTNSSDSTAAINAAIAAAKSSYPNGATVVLVPGQYAVSSINATNFNGLRLVGLGGAGAVVINSRYQTTAAPIVDFSGSSGIICENIIGGAPGVMTGQGPIPSAAFLIAGSNACVLRGCGSEGIFSSAALCIIATSNNAIENCRFQQWHPNFPCLNLSVSPDWYIASLYQNITQYTGDGTGENEFLNSEFHQMALAGHTTANCWTLYGRSIDNASFKGCTISNCSQGPSAKAYFLLQGGGNNVLSFEDGKFYSDSGSVPVNLLCNQGNLGRFISIGMAGDPPAASGQSPTYSGARIDGPTPPVNFWV